MNLDAVTQSGEVTCQTSAQQTFLGEHLSATGSNKDQPAKSSVQPSTTKASFVTTPLTPSADTPAPAGPGAGPMLQMQAWHQQAYDVCILMHLLSCKLRTGEEVNSCNTQLLGW